MTQKSRLSESMLLDNFLSKKRTSGGEHIRKSLNSLPPTKIIKKSNHSESKPLQAQLKKTISNASSATTGLTNKSLEDLKNRISVSSNSPVRVKQFPFDINTMKVQSYGKEQITDSPISAIFSLSCVKDSAEFSEIIDKMSVPTVQAYREKESLVSYRRPTQNLQRNHSGKKDQSR